MNPGGKPTEDKNNNNTHTSQAGSSHFVCMCSQATLILISSIDNDRIFSTNQKQASVIHIENQFSLKEGSNSPSAECLEQLEPDNTHFVDGSSLKPSSPRVCVASREVSPRCSCISYFRTIYLPLPLDRSSKMTWFLKQTLQLFDSLQDHNRCSFSTSLMYRCQFLCQLAGFFSKQASLKLLLLSATGFSSHTLTFIRLVT
jgi:hypothetical protein